MNPLVVGAIGHVDHGKTALVRALTGTDTDRLPEEKRRGVSIELGFAHLRSDQGDEIDLIDMPGHERFVRTMVAGATGIDAVLLVVAANEGIKPQTSEHVEIARLLGLRRAVAAISKADLASPAQLALLARQINQLLARAGLHARPPLITSALAEQGIAELKQALAALAAEPRSLGVGGGVAFLPIDRTFVMTGHGPVVTGTLRGAPLQPGGVLELIPAARKVRIRALQVHGQTVDAAEPGQRVALNLRDASIADLARGMVLASPGSLEAAAWLTLTLASAENAPPLRNGVRLRALLGTCEVEARLRLLDGEVLEAGQSRFAQLHCAQPVAIPAGEHVILRLASPAATVAGGRILDPLARRLRRNDPAVLQRLADLRALPPDRLIAAEIDRAGSAGTSVRALARLCALSESRIEALLAALPVKIVHGGAILRRCDLERLFATLAELLQRAPFGLSRKQLISSIPRTRALLLDEALARLTAEGLVARRGGQFMVPRPDEDRARARDEAELARDIAETLREAGLTPPLPAALLTDASSRRAVERLLREGTIVRAVDRAKQRELLFHRQAIDEARKRLAPLLTDGAGLLVTEIASALGISRKFTMPLLAHLDATRFTLRVGDRRVRC